MTGEPATRYQGRAKGLRERVASGDADLLQTLIKLGARPCVMDEMAEQEQEVPGAGPDFMDTVGAIAKILEAHLIRRHVTDPDTANVLATEEAVRAIDMTMFRARNTPTNSTKAASD